MRKQEDIQAEIDSLQSLRKILHAESDAIQKYNTIWMQARFNLKTEEEKKLFDLWIKLHENGCQLEALRWTLQDMNPRMIGDTEPKEQVPETVLVKIGFYHGMHTHVVCKLKGNLYHHYKSGDQERIDQTMIELRKYIPGI